MRRLRTLVVVHASLVPPESLEGHSDKEIEEWRTEYDVTTTLRKLGHDVRCIGVLDSLTELRSTIADWEPDIVFNLLEEFDGIVTYDQHVVAFLELMRQPYTGCNPRGLLLSRDKSLCKQLLAFHRIATPQFTVFRRGARIHVPRKLRFPLFVKSTVEDASLGIAQASVVEDAAKLKERIEFVHEQVKSDALVEEYIEGRELYVGVMGNERLTRLPVWEMVFGSMPDSLAAIATRKVKWDKRYQAKYGITTHAADDLPAHGADRARPAVAAHLPRTRHVRLCSHGLPRDPAGAGVRARGQCQSESRDRRGLRRVGARRGYPLRRAARAPHGPGSEVPRAVARLLWLSVPVVPPWLALAAVMLAGCADEAKKREGELTQLLGWLPGSYDNTRQQADSAQPAARAHRAAHRQGVHPAPRTSRAVRAGDRGR